MLDVNTTLDRPIDGKAPKTLPDNNEAKNIKATATRSSAHNDNHS